VVQSAFTVLTPVRLGETEALKALLNEIGDDIRGNPHLRFADLDDLHYASLFLVGEGTDRPSLGFEGNVDGRAGAFLERLVDRAGGAVDAIYRHCDGYPAAGVADRAGVVGYLRAHDIGAHTFYVNRPGRTVADIRQEQALRDHVEQFLDEHEEALRDEAPEAIRQAVCASLPDDMGWARTPAPTPFLVKHGPRVVRLALVPPAVSLLALLKTAGWRGSGRRAVTSRVVLANLVGSVGAAVVGLLSQERRDDRSDCERNWQAAYAEWTVNEIELGRREDRQLQNHMVSVTQVKAGWLRLAVLRVVLFVLNFVARVTANQGTLGSITSIHFARWVITPQGQLVFLSNFDGGWERYLSDFVDRASPGLTAVWSNTQNDVGFPSARCLVRRGSRDEARFKAYARSSMVPAYVWYSAYPDISAGNIATNMAVRDGLFAPPDPAATEAWLRHL
jgi:hypothetical protein